jgi:ribosomal protein S18 acetylase RimI-like enzyme
MLTLRAASPDDIEVIAEVWHRAWRDGHLGHVPEALLAHRDLESFLRRVPERLASTTLATLGGRIVGFVTVSDDELEQLYVDASARGSGAAVALIRHGERTIAERFERAWLAVATGNARARRFYAREGWSDAGPFDYAAQVAGGSIAVPCHRYEKHVAAAGPPRGQGSCAS